MNTTEIPEGWWLNVTVLANHKDKWIVGVLRKGITTWITEAAFSDFETSEEAYAKGMEFIKKYNAMLELAKKNK